MTILTIRGEESTGVHSGTWTVAKAKAKLSELIARAQSHGPQTITRHGRTAAIVVAPADWKQKTRRTGSLADFFAASPLRGSGLTVDRATDGPRPTDL